VAGLLLHAKPERAVDTLPSMLSAPEFAVIEFEPAVRPAFDGSTAEEHDGSVVSQVRDLQDATTTGEHPRHQASADEGAVHGHCFECLPS